MKKLRSALCLLGLLSLIPFMIHARHTLPMDTHPLIEKKYAGWSGVLRLWVFEGWSSGEGSLAAWLNRCIARYEKLHSGVYVQPRYVDADAIADFNDSGILPPDMLLFPPGLLESPEGLLPLDLPDNLRASLRRCGRWNGETYAIPIAMGGYLWAINRNLLDAIPADWNEANLVPAVYKPEAWRHWDAALLALCAGQRVMTDSDGGDTGLELPGIDLGLTGTQGMMPEATPSLDAPVFPCRLPAHFDFSEDAWRAFINGDAAAMPVTQREIRRLQILSDQGKGPDWRLSPGYAAFSDQLSLLGIVAEENATAQTELCRDFLYCLLADECQGELYRAGAFSVTDAFSGYSTGDPLATMESSVRSDALVAPNCFGDDWWKDVNTIVRNFMDGHADSLSSWQEIMGIIEQNPNID